MKLCAQNGYPDPEPLSGYLVNVVIPTGKVREFNVVWNLVTLHIVSAIADVANTVVKYYITVYLVV